MLSAPFAPFAPSPPPARSFVARSQPRGCGSCIEATGPDGAGFAVVIGSGGGQAAGLVE
jgi:hypothetical protein